MREVKKFSYMDAKELAINCRQIREPQLSGVMITYAELALLLNKAVEIATTEIEGGKVQQPDGSVTMDWATSLEQNKVFYNNKFDGHYPVGAAVIAVAPTKLVANTLITAELYSQGLIITNPQLEQTVEVDTSGTGFARVLVDGNY